MIGKGQHKRKSAPKKKLVHITSFEKTSETSQCVLNWSVKDIFDLLAEELRSPSLAALWEVRDILNLTRVCRSFHRIFNKAYLALVVRLGNLEPSLRYLFWISQAPYMKYTGVC